MIIILINPCIILFTTCILTTSVYVTNAQSPNLITDTLEDIDDIINNIGSISGSNIDEDVYEENPTIALQRALLGPLRTDPDAALTCSQWIESRGFECERHYVITKDGYILQNYRIVNPYAERFCAKRKPVLLLHGLTGSCSFWLFNSPGGHIEPWVDGKPPNDTSAALGYHLANQGYDVWLINVRGTSYSTNHTYLDPYKDSEFWDFTFYDIAIYDVTATVDHIKQVTGYERITAIGHSQGTTQLLIQMSVMTEYQKNYDLVILVSPAAYVGNVRSLFGVIPHLRLTNSVLADLKLPFPPLLSVIDAAATAVCSRPIAQSICLELVNGVLGPDSPQTNASRSAVYTSCIDRSSIKNIVHYLQAMGSDHIRFFDYGETENLVLYGSPEPPIFPYYRINSSKLILIKGLNDIITTTVDVQKLSNSLDGPPIVDYTVPFPLWNHLDPGTAIEGYQYFSNPVRQFIEKYGDD